MSASDLEEVAANMTADSTPSDTGANATGRRRPPPSRNSKADSKSADASDKAPDAADEDVAEDTTTNDTAPPAPPKANNAPATTTSRAMTRTTSAAAASAAMPTQNKAGDLVQVRVQPPHVGAWLNNLIDAGQFAFSTTQGTIAGAVLLIAQQHSDEIVRLLETWGGDAMEADEMRGMLWEVWKAKERKRRAQAGVQVIDADAEGDAG